MSPIRGGCPRAIPLGQRLNVARSRRLRLLRRIPVIGTYIQTVENRNPKMCCIDQCTNRRRHPKFLLSAARCGKPPIADYTPSNQDSAEDDNRASTPHLHSFTTAPGLCLLNPPSPSCNHLRTSTSRACNIAVPVDNARTYLRLTPVLRCTDLYHIHHHLHHLHHLNPEACKPTGNIPQCPTETTPPSPRRLSC